MPTAISSPTVFPPLTPEYILSFQFSSWFPKFSRISIRSTIIRPLDQDFFEYLDSDGVIVPEGSEDMFVFSFTSSLLGLYLIVHIRPAETTLSDDGEDDEEEAVEGPRYAFPVLDAQIREVIKDYGAVFPKLNFSSPKVNFNTFH